MSNRKCFACDRKLNPNPHVAVTLDGQKVYVGSDCYRKIGPHGWQPPKGGPRLYRGRLAPNGDLLERVEARDPTPGKKEKRN